MTIHQDRGRSSEFQWVHRAFLALAFGSAVLALFKPLSRLGHRVFFEYNEGWMACFSRAAAAGEPLYRPMNDFVLNNYPPLSFYITGALGAWTGDHILAGRLLAMVGLLVTAALTGVLVWRLTHDRFPALMAAFTLVGYMGFHHEDYVAMNDPQWMAHAFVMTALTLFMSAEKKRSVMAVTALVIVVGGLLKHSLAAIPLGISIWMYRNDRRNFWFWIVCLFGFVFMALMAMGMAFGPVAFESILMAPRVYRPGAIARAGVWLLPAAVYIGGLLTFLILSKKSPDERLIAVILLVAWPLGLLFLGGAGVYNNALYEALIFSLVASFNLLGHDMPLSTDAWRNNRLRVLGMGVLILPVILVAPFRFYQSKEYVRRIADMEAQTRNDVAFVAQHGEPVLCENLALVYWAGKAFTFDVFTCGQKLETGNMSYDTIRPWLEKRRFAVIQTNDADGSGFPPGLMEGIRNNYRVIRSSGTGGFFWVPKE